MNNSKVKAAILETQAFTQGSSEAYLPHIAKGATINLSGMIARTLLASGYTVFLARVLPVNELGNFFLIFTIINILGLSSVLGLDFGVVRFVALYAGEGRFHLARRTLAVALLLAVPLGVLVALAVIIWAPLVTKSLLGNDPAATSALRVFALSIPFWVAAKLFNATTQGLHLMHCQVYSRDLGEQISKFVFTILVLTIGSGLVGIVWANVASVVVAMFMSMLFAIKMLPRGHEVFSFKKAPNPARSLFLYSLPLAFSNVLGMVLVWIDMLLLGYLGTTTETGYYGAAMRLVVLSASLFLAFSTVFTPVISDLYNKRRIAELHLLYKTVTRWVLICTLPFVLLQLLFSDPIMKIFGSEFVAGSQALVVLAISQLINAFSGPAGQMVLMSGHSKMELFNITVSLIVNITFCFLLIPDYGIVGAALANVVATITINLMRAAEVWFLMHMHAYNFNYVKSLLAAAVTAIVVALAGRYVTDSTGTIEVAVLATCTVVVYTAATVIMGLSKQDKAVLDLVKKRLMQLGAGGT